MNRKQVGAAVTGAALLAWSVAGAVAQEVPPTDFFINPETGTPRVIIVVGSSASDMDVISAAMISAKVFSMSYPVESSEITFTKTYKAIHENVEPFLHNFSIDTALDIELPDQMEGAGFPTVDVPDAWLYKKQDHNTIPINYRIRALWYFDDHPHKFWGNGDLDFQPWETHEEIQIRFDDFHCVQDDTMISPGCAAHLYGGDVTLYNLSDELTTLHWYSVPGLIYRADNIFAPPMLLVEPDLQLVEAPFPSADLEKYTVLHIPEPWMVVQERLPEFNLFNISYTVVDAGPVLDINPSTGKRGSLHGTPYLVTGEPHFEPKVYLYENELVKFSDFTVELLEGDPDWNEGLLQVSHNGTILDTFSMAMDPWCRFPYPPPDKYRFLTNVEQEDYPFGAYETVEDVNGNGELDPGEITNIITYDFDQNGTPDYSKWVVGQIDYQLWAYHTWKHYTDDENNSWLLFGTTDFVIEGVKVFIASEGKIGSEIKVYWLENKEYWYNHLCCNPWVTGPDYQLFIDAYQTGWDNIEGNHYMYQPPGTGLWPPSGLVTWQNYLGKGMFCGNGFLDCNDGHVGSEYNLLTTLLPGTYFPEQYDLDTDRGTTNDCRTSTWSQTEKCTDSYDIEDPAIWHSPGLIMVEINISLCNTLCAPDSSREWVIPGPSLKDPYFTIEVTDVYFTCRDRDGIDYDTIFEIIQTADYSQGMCIQWDTTSIIVADTAFDFEGWKATCTENLILVGGPVSNIIVRKLVSGGFSAVDWETSPGEWEYILDPYNTCDVLIVAGADRDATREAAFNLIDQLQ